MYGATKLSRRVGSSAAQTPPLKIGQLFKETAVHSTEVPEQTSSKKKRKIKMLISGSPKRNHKT
jgi:hypothetical protein